MRTSGDQHQARDRVVAWAATYPAGAIARALDVDTTTVRQILGRRRGRPASLPSPQLAARILATNDTDVAAEVRVGRGRGQRPGGRRIYLDDLEVLVGSGLPLPAVAERLGVQAESVLRACRRHGRWDLHARLTTTTTRAAA